MKKVLILGKGRIGKSIKYYFKKIKFPVQVNFFLKEKEVKNSSLLIGALPGEMGEKSLNLALKYKKDLIDLADLEAEFYLKKKREIEKKGITVISGCGFCPGLVNFILGQEISNNKNIKEIEIKVGTLSKRKKFFPFLWCFEDLTLEHQIPSQQRISGRKIKFPPFVGYQKEKFYGIEAESYFSQSGFDNLIDYLKIQNFKFRVIRPLGFFWFFQFLKNQGFFRKDNLKMTKEILESQKEDNLTLAEIKIVSQNKKILWRIKSFSKKEEGLNSMQKITGTVPVFVAEALLKDEIKEKGLLFMEEVGKNKKLFKEILEKLKKEKILIKRR